MSLFLVGDVEHVFGPEALFAQIQHPLGMLPPAHAETAKSGGLHGIFNHVCKRKGCKTTCSVVLNEGGVSATQSRKAGQRTAAHQDNLPGVRRRAFGLHALQAPPPLQGMTFTSD